MSNNIRTSSGHFNHMQAYIDAGVHDAFAESIERAPIRNTLSTNQASSSSSASKTHRYMTRQTQNSTHHNYAHQSTYSSNPTHFNNNHQTTGNTLPAQMVVLRPLPFYDKIYELVKPIHLPLGGSTNKHLNESKFTFTFTIEQANEVAMSRATRHVILRFCYLDISKAQDDSLPPDLVISINGTQVLLPPAITNPNRPEVPPKRPNQHVDITKLCKLCPFVENVIQVRWVIDPTDPDKKYALSAIIGTRNTSETLLERIKLRGLSDPESTKRIISDTDNEIATTNLTCSLVCPLGKMRLNAPCKSITCKHIPCFDALVYLQMNERKATWICPVCYKPAYFPDLMIDGYFTNILANTSPNITEVTLSTDGSWSPLLKAEQPVSAKNPQPEIITISDDED